MLTIKYKLLHSGIAPIVATSGAAAADLAISADITIGAHDFSYIPLEIAFDIPEHAYITIYARSSLLALGLLAPVSIIDSDYKRGIHAQVYNYTDNDITLERGQRVLQMIPSYREPIDYVLVNEIEDTGRGGLGSTG